MFWAKGCAPCERTKKWLASKEVEFETTELITKEDFDNFGFTSVPVVFTEKGTWLFKDGLPKLKELLDS